MTRASDRTDVYELPDGRIFEVPNPYYLGSCDRCGWIGSTEECGTDSFGDDSDVYCPTCFSSGCDCGKVAATAVLVASHS